jgi:Domain of unknown function (DUF222)/HNH endonuclease
MDGHSPLEIPAPNHAILSLAHRSLETLEADITELWGHLNAATYRFLTLVAEFDRNEGYVRHGLVNTGQWLNWQCGIGAVAAREKVRVARALEALPEISASFARGELSYSKVRAMTRVATAANESVLLNVALHGTAEHVERLVRKYKWTERRDADRRALAQHATREVHYFYDEAGMFVLHARLPAEVGAVVLKALEAAGETLWAAESERGGEPAEDVSAETGTDVAGNVSAETNGAGAVDDAEPQSTAAMRRADALAHMAERFLEQRADDAGSGSNADRYQVVVHVDQAVLTRAVAADEREPHCCELDEGSALALETARRLGCDATFVGIVEDTEHGPLDIGRKTRAISPALARALRARDGGCRFPGCTRTRFTEGHHVRHWADGGETKLGNLVTLCRYHHRLVHEGGFGLTVTDDGVLVFTRPDGGRIAEGGRCFSGNTAAEPARSGKCFSGNILATPTPGTPRPGARAGIEQTAAARLDPTLGLRELNAAAGLVIDAATSRSRWQGEALDYSMAIEGMLYPS